MNVKNAALTLAALVLGAGVGYVVADKKDSDVPQKQQEETRSAKAIADNGEQASLKALRARISELEQQLAKKSEAETMPVCVPIHSKILRTISTKTICGPLGLEGTPR